MKKTIRQLIRECNSPCRELTEEECNRILKSSTAPNWLSELARKTLNENERADERETQRES